MYADSCYFIYADSCYFMYAESCYFIYADSRPGTVKPSILFMQKAVLELKLPVSVQVVPREFICHCLHFQGLGLFWTP